jgi:hypothetical protein
MNKELDYLNISYTDSDKDYIDYISKEVDEKSKKIIDFFEIKDYKDKSKVIIINNIDEFRQMFLKENNTYPPDWVCGFAKDKNIWVLSFDEYKKTHNHENDTIDDMIKLVLHEFVHNVYKMRSTNMEVKWLSEGAATYLSDQYPNAKSINCTYEELLSNTSYTNYKVMFNYVLNTYGKDYILKLIDDINLLNKETKRLYEEAKGEF